MIDSLIASSALENDLRNLLGNICLLICKYEKLGLGIYPESKNRTKQKKERLCSCLDPTNYSNSF